MSDTNNPPPITEPPPPSTDPFASFDTAVTAAIAGNNIATATQIATITTTLPLAEQLAFVVLSGNIGSSARTSYPDGGPNATHSWSTCADTIKRACTVRQFCMYYAAWYYSACRARNTPPANWARRGFSFSTRYAGFDFFDGATLTNGYNPPGLNRRTPDANEILAAQAVARVHIYRTRADESNTTLVELTGGRPNNRPQLALPPPPTG
jgi:hypothetical protein